MKITRLIEVLERFREERGDIDVVGAYRPGDPLVGAIESVAVLEVEGRTLLLIGAVGQPIDPGPSEGGTPVSAPHSDTCACVIGARAVQAIDYLRQCWTGPEILAAFPLAVEPSRTFIGVRLRLDAPTSELLALIAEADVQVRLRVL